MRDRTHICCCQPHNIQVVGVDCAGMPKEMHQVAFQ